MIVESLAHGREVLKRLTSPLRGFPLRWLVLDTETRAKAKFSSKDALVIGRTEILVITLCRLGESYTFPSSHVAGHFPTVQEWLQLLDPYFMDAKVFKVYHNANYDANAKRTEGLKLARLRNLYCTMIGAWKANAAIEKGLKSRAPLYGRKLRKTKNVDFSNLVELAEYGEEDVIQADELFQMQQFGKVKRTTLGHLNAKGVVIFSKPRLPLGDNIVIENEDLDEMEKLELELQEFPYLRATLRAEERGFPFNVKRLQEIRQQLELDKDKILRKIVKMAGRTINIGSSKQMASLFKELKIPSVIQTKKGAPSFNAEALFHIKTAHPIVPLISEYKSMEKLQTVYVGDPTKKTPAQQLGLEYYVQSDGTIRAMANTVGAVTGRGSSSNPNLTQIPSAKDKYAIKDCFTA